MSNELPFNGFGPQVFVAYACERLGIKQSALVSKRRDRELCSARHAIAYVLREKSHQKLSLEFIASLLGRDNHVTIIRGMQRAQDLYETDEKFRERLKLVAEIPLLC